MKKILMLINDTTYAYNLRGALIKRLVTRKYEVVIVCQILEHMDDLKKLDVRIIGVNINRHGTNPLYDLKLMNTYRAILKKEKPDMVLTYNIKPNSYGGMMCKLLGIPYIPNITGLGTPVENPGKLQKIAIQLYKMGVSGAVCVMFQNENNRQFFIEHRMLKPQTRTRIIPGSGVDLEKYPVLPWNEESIHFLFAARIMKEKGIDLFLAAARKFARDGVVFDICGQCDDEHYKDILVKEKCVQYHGKQENMNPFYEKCTCFLYPSYYPEGMSNVLLEAAASGRPVIAANRAGCREILEDGVTGYLVSVNDEQTVIKAINKVLAMSINERKEMGAKGRRKVEKEFDREFVVDAYIEEITKVIGK